MTTLLKYHVRDNYVTYGLYGLFTIMSIVLAILFRANSLDALTGVGNTVFVFASLAFAGLTIYTTILFFGYFFHDFDEGEGTLAMLLPITAKKYVLSRYLATGITLFVYFVLVISPFAFILSPIYAGSQGFFMGFSVWDFISLREVIIALVTVALFIAVYGFVYVLVSLPNFNTFISVVLGIAAMAAVYYVISLITVGLLMLFGYGTSFNFTTWTGVIFIGRNDLLGHIVYLGVRVALIVLAYLSTAYMIDKKLSV